MKNFALSDQQRKSCHEGQRKFCDHTTTNSMSTHSTFVSNVTTTMSTINEDLKNIDEFFQEFSDLRLTLTPTESKLVNKIFSSTLELCSNISTFLTEVKVYAEGILDCDQGGQEQSLDGVLGGGEHKFIKKLDELGIITTDLRKVFDDFDELAKIADLNKPSDLKLPLCSTAPWSLSEEKYILTPTDKEELAKLCDSCYKQNKQVVTTIQRGPHHEIRSTSCIIS